MGLDIPDFQAYQGTEPPRFASQAELECAKVLDYYGIPWLYEPRTFVLEEDEDGRVREAFAPDFYLPEQDLYIELTVMKQSLVTRKNRKLRKLRERYPDIRIKLFYKRDLERLAQHFRLDLASVDPRIGEVYLSADELAARVGELGAEIARDYEGREPLLVGSLKASFVFLTDLSRAMPIAARARLRRARRLRQRADGRPRADPRPEGSRRRHRRPRRDRRRGRDRHRAHAQLPRAHVRAARAALRRRR